MFDKEDKVAAHCLTLPGKTLYLTPLLAQKKFRGYGNKDSAVRAFFKLEEDGLGKTFVIGTSRVNPVRMNNNCSGIAESTFRTSCLVT